MKKYIPLLVLGCAALLIQPCTAATVPTGTMLQVRTSTSISSREPVGRTFTGTLAQDVVVGRTAVLPRGTQVSGVVQSPRVQRGSTTRPLTLRLTGVTVGGRNHSITTDSTPVNQTLFQTRTGANVTGGTFILPHGTNLQFRLSKPISM